MSFFRFSSCCWMDSAFISSMVYYVYLCLWRQLKLDLSILLAMWQVNPVLGFSTGVHHRQKGKGGKRQEKPVRRIGGEAGASPGQCAFTKFCFGWLEPAGEGTSLWGCTEYGALAVFWRFASETDSDRRKWKATQRDKAANEVIGKSNDEKRKAPLKAGK